MNTGQNQNQSSNQSYNQNTNTGNYNNVPPKQNYPKRRSTFAVVAGIVLVLMGASYVLNQFVPWIFNWLDSGLVIACVAIVAGFALIVKKGS